MDKNLPLYRRLAISAFVVAFVGFCLANFAFRQFNCFAQTLDGREFKDHTLGKLCGRSACWWISRSYFDSARAPDIVLLGSSQACVLLAADADTVNRDVDYTTDHEMYTLERDMESLGHHKVKAILAGMPGAVVSDYYITARALFTEKRKPRIAIICFSPRDFMDNLLTSIGATEAFHFFSSRTDIGDLVEVAFPKWEDRVFWYANCRMPLRQLTKPINAQLDKALTFGNVKDLDTANDNVKRQKDGEAVAAAQRCGASLLMDSVKPGQFVLHPHAPKIYIDNSVEYAARYQNANPPGFTQQTFFLDRLLSLLEEENIKAVCVNMPLLPSNRAQLPPALWTNYNDKIKQITIARGARYLDLSQCPVFKRADFIDSVHLNADGAAKLSSLIARAVDASETPACRLASEKEKGSHVSMSSLPK